MIDSHPRLGIDLGGTKIEAIVMNEHGDISHRLRCDTPQGDYQDTLDAIVSLTNEITSSANLSDLTPIGIGAPGAVSLKTGLMMNCNSTCLNGKPLAADLEKASGRSVRIANDADCFALSEASDGHGAGSDWVVGVILGTGVGGGLAINQRLSDGVNAIRGEWGHNTLPYTALQCEVPGEIAEDPHGCFCGRSHCVETWLAGPAFEKHFSLITGKSLSAKEIMQLVRSGDDTAKVLFQLQLHILALAFSNIVNILDPDVIVCGGGLSNITEIYQQLPDVLPQYVFSDVLNTRVVPAKHGDSSGVRGAAWLWQTDEVGRLIGDAL